MNNFTARVRAGLPVTMVNAGGRNPDVVPLLRDAGATSVFVDCERTGIGLDAAADLIVAARACGLPAVVRSHSYAAVELIRFLDRGADALVVPHIETVEQVADAAKAMRYVCGDDASRSLVIQIETKAALAQLREIAAVPGVDAFIIGPNDIAYEWSGMRGRHTPESQAAIEEACRTLSSLGKCFGYPAKAGEPLETFRRRGARLLYVSIDWLLDAGMRGYRLDVDAPAS
ncbi:MAG: aldolase/citrate lyase family protein [Pseudomonadota bacterium]